MATMRLQTALLWADLEERLTHLHLDAEKEQLANKVEHMRQRPRTAQEALDQMNARDHEERLGE